MQQLATQSRLPRADSSSPELEVDNIVVQVASGLEAFEIVGSGVLVVPFNIHVRVMLNRKRWI